MSKTKEIGIIVKKYLDEYPDKPNLTLAKIINKENGIPIEQGRNLIRYYRGSVGSKNREKVGLSPKVPKSLKKDWKPYLVPSEFKKTLLIADLHIPEHDEKAIETTIEYAVKRGIDSIIIDGDMIDCYMLSIFSKDPSKARFIKELEIANEFLDYLDDKFPKAKIFYKLANHEERLDRYVKTNASELYGIANITMASLLDCLNRGMVVIDDKRIIKYGHLNIVHGDELGKSIIAPVNIARGLFLKTKAITVGAHHHQSSSHSETDINGKMTTCWSIGCLSDLRPEYLRVNKWNHGFALLERGDNDSFHLENYKIIEGKVYNA